MLINYSNHPASYWPEEQLNAAREAFGQVVDLAFPQVDPEGDLGYLDALADEGLEKVLNIRQQYADEPLAVHLMGEISLCFQLADRLRRCGIRCLVSTTKREVFQTPDGKLSKFRFVRFRDYYQLDHHNQSP